MVILPMCYFTQSQYSTIRIRQVSNPFKAIGTKCNNDKISTIFIVTIKTENVGGTRKNL